MKKKTKKKTAKKKPAQNVVKNCTMIGVQYDAKAIEAIGTVAQALLVNAKALHNLANVFDAQGINIECLVKLQ